MAAPAARDVSYVELLSIKNAHIETLQRRKDFLAEATSLSQQRQSCASISIAFLGELLDDVIVDTCFEIHRKIKIDSNVCHICRQVCDAVTTGSLAASGPHPEPPAFDCDHCQTQRCSASRYATHLENCMGFGRRARRNATTVAQSMAPPTSSQTDVDSFLSNGADDDDDDFVDYGDGKKRKKSSKAKVTKKTKKGGEVLVSSPDAGPLAVGNRSPLNKKGVPRTSNMGTPTDPEGLNRRFANALVQSKSQAELRQLFDTTCGVLSTSTGKSCNKSVRCSIHTDDQRQIVRSLCLQPDFPQHTPAADGDTLALTPSVVDYDGSMSHGGSNGADESAEMVSPTTLAEVNEYIDIESDGEN